MRRVLLVVSLAGVIVTAGCGGLLGTENGAVEPATEPATGTFEIHHIDVGQARHRLPGIIRIHRRTITANHQSPVIRLKRLADGTMHSFSERSTFLDSLHQARPFQFVNNRVSVARAVIGRSIPPELDGIPRGT